MRPASPAKGRGYAARVATAPAAPPSPGAYLRLILISARDRDPRRPRGGASSWRSSPSCRSGCGRTCPTSSAHSSPPWYLVVFLPVVGRGRGRDRPALPARRRRPRPDRRDSTRRPPLSARPGRRARGARHARLRRGAGTGGAAHRAGLGGGAGRDPVHPLGDQGERVVGTAGAASAVSAVFGGPLVAGFLLMEVGVGMGSMLIPALLPGPGRGGHRLRGHPRASDNWGRINEAGLSVPDLPVYHDVSVRDMLIAVVVGVVAAVVMARRAPASASAPAGCGHAASAWPPCCSPAASRSGLLAVAADALGADTQDVLFSGQDSLPALVGRGLGAGAAGAPGRQGDRVRHLPRLRLPRRPGVPGDLPRRRA